MNNLTLDPADLQFAASVLGRTVMLRAGEVFAQLPDRGVRRPGATTRHSSRVGCSDSDWAGSRASRGARRSTSGGIIVCIGAVLKTWSNRQGPVTPSSGEAEYGAVAKTVGEHLHVKSVAHDFGWLMNIKGATFGSPVLVAPGIGATVRVNSGISCTICQRKVVEIGRSGREEDVDMKPPSTAELQWAACARPQVLVWIFAPRLEGAQADVTVSFSFLHQ